MFITEPGDTDVLMVVTAVILGLSVFGFGILFLRLHTLPERVAHKAHKIQFEIVAIFGLLALFTHMHIFWVAGLMLAFIDIPDFGGIPGPHCRLGREDSRTRAGRGRIEMRGNRRPTPRPWRGRFDHRGSASPPKQKTQFAPSPAARRATMLEMLLCSLVTLLPDYLYRRYVQGKRFGKEITLYSVWFELRWGITGCLILTVALITTVFYNHPSTTNVTLFFRTVPILPETNGRVAEVYVGLAAPSPRAHRFFGWTVQSRRQRSKSARRKIVETEAQLLVARADIVKADGQVAASQERASADGG